MVLVVCQVLEDIFEVVEFDGGEAFGFELCSLLQYQLWGNEEGFLGHTSSRLTCSLLSWRFAGPDWS